MEPAPQPNPHVAVVVPCFNAGSRVCPVVDGALRHAASIFVVDDGSTDGAATPLAGPGVTVLVHARNQGKGHALRTGIAAALQREDVRAICLIDADGQHDPASIPALCAPVLDGSADLVVGMRHFDRSQVPFRSWLGNTVTAWVTRRLLGHDLPDTQCGFRALSADFAATVLATVAGGRYETEMEMLVRAIRGGHRLAAVPIETRYEAGNASSHFRKVRDSVRIYARLLAAVLRR
jgi:glycosyltransferase involved in cell wall biosynthesis